MKTVFVQSERCIGCRQCMFACAVEHSRSRDPVSAVFEDPLPRSRIHVQAGSSLCTSFPNRCRHCDPAPCQQSCPTGAISRQPDLDLVLVDERRCIACATCAMVCPFDAVRFHQLTNGDGGRVVATKCDGCVERVRQGRVPACVEACKVGALVYGDVNELIARRQARRQPESGEERKEPAAAIPEQIQAWRDWGEEATVVVQEVAS